MPHARRRLRLDDPVRAAGPGPPVRDGRAACCSTTGRRVELGAGRDAAAGACVACMTGSVAQRAGAGMTAREPVRPVERAAPQAGDQPAARPAPSRRRGHRPVHRAARRADRRGRAGHVPLARATPTRCWSGTGWSGCPTRCRCAGCADTDLWYVTHRAARGVADRVPVRAASAASTASSTSTTRSTPGSRTARSASSSVLRGRRLRGAGLGQPRPRGPSGRAGRASMLTQQGAAPRACASSSTCRPGSGPGRALPAADRARRRRLPQLRRARRPCSTT